MLFFTIQIKNLLLILLRFIGRTLRCGKLNRRIMKGIVYKALIEFCVKYNKKADVALIKKNSAIFTECFS